MITTISMMKDTLDKMKHWLDSAEEKIVKYLKWSIERKKKRAASCGTASSGLIYTYMESPKERSGGGMRNQKKIWENKSIGPKSPMKPSRRNMKETTQRHHSQIAENQL